MKGVFSFIHKFSFRSQHQMAYSLENGLPSEFIGKYGLSSRETEITEVLLQGKSNKEIAALLGITLNTVQVHAKNIYRKTGVRSRYALMALVGLGK